VLSESHESVTDSPSNAVVLFALKKFKTGFGRVENKIVFDVETPVGVYVQVRVKALTPHFMGRALNTGLLLVVKRFVYVPSSEVKLQVLAPVLAQVKERYS
jgi:hypothetical protein